MSWFIVLGREMQRHQFFKFTYSSYVDRIISGESIKVGTLDEYRGEDTIEVEDYWRSGLGADQYYTKGLVPGIDDPMEGTTFQYLDQWVGPSPTGPTPRDIAIAEAMSRVTGTGISPYGHGVTMQNVVVRRRLPNAYVFCGSKYNRQSVIEQIKADSAKASITGEPYDRCIPIIEPDAFASAVAAAIGVLEGWDTSIEAVHGDVEYGAIVNDLGAPALSGGPMRKHEAFRPQKEYRVFLPRVIEPGKKGALVNLPGDSRKLFGEPFPI